jgi:hypothetical protein
MAGLLFFRGDALNRFQNASMNSGTLTGSYLLQILVADRFRPLITTQLNGMNF